MRGIKALVASLLALVSGALGAEPYVSARLGYASAEFALGAPYNGVVDDRSMLYGVTVGFAFERRWSIEAGFDGYEGFDGFATPCVEGASCPTLIRAVDDNDLNLFHFALAPRVDVGNWRLFGKVGYYHGRIDTHVGLPDDDFTENGLLLGAGVRWTFSSPWSVSFEANRFDDKIYQLALGLGWGFRGPD